MDGRLENILHMLEDGLHEQGADANICSPTKPHGEKRCRSTPHRAFDLPLPLGREGLALEDQRTMRLGLASLIAWLATQYEKLLYLREGTLSARVKGPSIRSSQWSRPASWFFALHMRMT